MAHGVEMPAAPRCMISVSPIDSHPIDSEKRL